MTTDKGIQSQLCEQLCTISDLCVELAQRFDVADITDIRALCDFCFDKIIPLCLEHGSLMLGNELRVDKEKTVQLLARMQNLGPAIH